MKNPNTLASSPTKSLLLVGSTSSYFGGTGVTAYIASKHGVLGLLRACQVSALNLGIRVNAVAPFLTPTHITAGFAQRWRDQGLEANTPERVAEVIAIVALDDERKGHCVLVSLWLILLLDCTRLQSINAMALMRDLSKVAGKYLREMETSRTKLLPVWLGDDVAEFMARAMQFFVSIGGYVLPRKY